MAHMAHGAFSGFWPWRIGSSPEIEAQGAGAESRYETTFARVVDTEAGEMISTLDHLPRYVSLHQLARRSGIHRNALTLLMARGQLKPTAMQNLGDGREGFLFPASTIDKLTRPAGDTSLL